VRVVRAKLRQFNHDFAAAVADLQAAVQAQPGLAEGWSWLAAIAMVQARYDDVRSACARLLPLTSALTASACRAGADAVTGQADTAVASLRQALARAPDASAAEKLWALTRLAETEERRGDFPAAEAAFKAALALGQTDSYLLAAYADFLLDRGRPAEVLALLKGRERADLLLLRLALAARDAKAPEAAALAQALGERFDAARLRGDTTHQKEEARYALALRGDTQRALALAQANWAVQKEPADARVLLEAAVAAKAPPAAQTVLQWMAQNQLQSVALQGLAQRLGAGAAK
jgi:Tfp pilus assembly protein PilF